MSHIVVFCFIIFNTYCSALFKLNVENSSDDKEYYSESNTCFYIGTYIFNDWESHYYPQIGNSKIILNLSYRISNFKNSPKENSFLVGLSNEIGVNVFELYIKSGPELRFGKSIYVIPHIGVTSSFSKIFVQYISFDMFMGINVGYLHYIGKTKFLDFEYGISKMILTNQVSNSYIKVGFCFYLF